MAGAMGWSVAQLREASLAEIWTHWIGHACAGVAAQPAELFGRRGVRDQGAGVRRIAIA